MRRSQDAMSFTLPSYHPARLNPAPCANGRFRAPPFRTSSRRAVACRRVAFRCVDVHSLDHPTRNDEVVLDGVVIVAIKNRGEVVDSNDPNALGRHTNGPANFAHQFTSRGIELRVWRASTLHAMPDCWPSAPSTPSKSSRRAKPLQTRATRLRKHR